MRRLNWSGFEFKLFLLFPLAMQTLFLFEQASKQSDGRRTTKKHIFKVTFLLNEYIPPFLHLFSSLPF